MCLRMTAPFLVSASPLSLLCRGRLLVCSMSSLFSNRATTRLMNSLPLSEWKPRMRKGNCRSRAHSTGSSQASLMRSVVVGMAVLAVFSLHNPARGEIVEVLMGVIDAGQQFQAVAGIALRKAMPPVRRGLERSAFAIASDQAGHLRPAPGRHLHQIAA